MNTPNLTDAMKQIESLSGYFAERELDPPTESQAQSIINMAFSRGRYLSRPEWLKVWRLGKQKLATATDHLRDVGGEDMDDATAFVAHLFSPDESHDTVAALSQ